jgi:hypothetical protein
MCLYRHGHVEPRRPDLHTVSKHRITIPKLSRITSQKNGDCDVCVVQYTLINLIRRFSKLSTRLSVSSEFSISFIFERSFNTNKVKSIRGIYVITRTQHLGNTSVSSVSNIMIADPRMRRKSSLIFMDPCIVV